MKSLCRKYFIFLFLLSTNVISLKFEINKFLQVKLYMNIKADL